MGEEPVEVGVEPRLLETRLQIPSKKVIYGIFVCFQEVFIGFLHLLGIFDYFCVLLEGFLYLRRYLEPQMARRE